MTHDEAMQLLTEYEERKAELAPALSQLELMEKRIKEYILTENDPLETSVIRTEIRNGYTRSNWDDKKLRGFALVHPEIMDCCKVSEVGRAVVFKFKVQPLSV